MSFFSEQFTKHCAQHNTTPHKVGLNTPDVDPTKVSKAINSRKMEDKAWETLLKGLSENTLAPIKYDVLVGWRLIDRYGEDAIFQAAIAKYGAEGLLKRLQEMNQRDDGT